MTPLVVPAPVAGSRAAFPPATQDFCHEIELVVAIGCGGSGIASDQAQSHHIWGYASGLDLTRRDLPQQANRSGGPWEPAKAFDGSAPCSLVVSARDRQVMSSARAWRTLASSR